MQRGGVASPFAARQLLWGIVSAVVYVFILKVSYRSAIKAAVPLFAATVAVLIVLLSTVTTTFLDVYSNAVSAQSLFPKLGTRPAVLADLAGAPAWAARA